MDIRLTKIIWGLFVSSLFILLFSGGSTAGVPQDSHKILSLKEKDILVSSVYNYKERIHEYNEDVLRLKSDREWLEVKIKRIEDEKRQVPLALTSAVDRIDMELIRYDSEILRLTAMTEKHLSDLRMLDAKVTVANGNSAPEWWAFDEWIYQLMYPGKEIPSRPSMAPGMDGKETQAFMVSNSALKRDLEQKIKDIELDNWVAIVQDSKGLSLEVQLPILFGLGKSDVAKDYIPFFKKLSWLVKSYPINVEVEGYSDGKAGNDMPFSARMALGANRAANVVQELVDTGLQPEIFKIISDDEYGYADPEKKNLSAAMKRRVEIRVHFQSDQG